MPEKKEEEEKETPRRSKRRRLSAARAFQEPAAAAAGSSTSAQNVPTISVRGQRYPVFGSSFQSLEQDDTVVLTRQGGGDVEIHFRQSRQAFA